MKLNSKGSKSVEVPHIDGNAAHICPSTKMASEYGEKPLSSRANTIELVVNAMIF